MARKHKTSNCWKSQVHLKLITKSNIVDTKLKGEPIAILNFDFDPPFKKTASFFFFNKERSKEREN